ncbi:hypothetical protein OIU78_001018 [Salix suchowensis]|nr:hypothetical protein OIU78_001018 [Salix suchowensis]
MVAAENNHNALLNRQAKTLNVKVEVNGLKGNEEIIIVGNGINDGNGKLVSRRRQGVLSGPSGKQVTQDSSEDGPSVVLKGNTALRDRAKYGSSVHVSSQDG